MKIVAKKPTITKASFFLCASASFAGLLSPAAMAADLISVTVTISNGIPAGQAGSVNSSVTKTFNDQNTAFSYFQTTNLATIFPNYVSTDTVTSTVNSAGTTAVVSFPNGGTTANVTIPSSGQTYVFTGATQAQTLTQIQAVTNGTGTAVSTTGQVVTGAQFVALYQKALVQTSPVNLTAGNPTSLQSQVVGNAFSATAFAPQSDTSMTAGPFTIGIDGGTFSSQGFDGNYVSVPLGYTYKFDDSGYAVNIRVPLTYTSIQGKEIGSVAASLAGQIPTGVKGWYIAPSFGYGFAGSDNLNQAAQFLGGAATSRYSFDLKDVKVTLGDMLGYYSTSAVTFRGTSFDAHLNNMVTKNGIEAEIPIAWSVMDTPLSIKGSYAFTHFFGKGLYTNDTQEIGASIGAASGTSIFLNSLRIGLTGILAKSYSGVTGNLSISF